MVHLYQRRVLSVGGKGGGGDVGLSKSIYRWAPNDAFDNEQSLPYRPTCILFFGIPFQRTL